MKQIAIIGPTASGKSDLAIEMALQHNAYILSIDSLSIYKEIDIASAKPSAHELAKVKHFGINEIYLDTHFSVATFIQLYKKAYQKALHDGKNLIIVGGTSFYLKSLTSGLSQLPEYSEATKAHTARMLLDLPRAYAYLQERDPEYMKAIEATDAYRIEKMLLLVLESGMGPTAWFNAHPPKPVIEQLDIFNIDVERALLRERIVKRTYKMAASGLIDEVAILEHKYGRNHNAMKAIGIIEVLAYLDGECTKEAMIENIITHTAQLAKRQQTFNRTQFEEAVSASLSALPQLIAEVF
ncbi:tRNA (adenosine(37)-N6)-dimethylallyltransferase MiaA [Sulfurimonas sp. HSL3-7]|uniref:tRNA (adenosine(37)-N6)-dimethylallyltransferase MiaA n=1 Tax=Sulfonitrofixus jiaomeiensis TaxID=3131938 RepID=UPI0031F97C04